MHYAVDLHTHSAASDGQYTPAQLIQAGKGHGLEVAALTDHDTMGGIAEAIRAGKQCGIHVISGVELSAKEYPAFHGTTMKYMSGNFGRSWHNEAAGGSPHPHRRVGRAAQPC